MSTPTDEIEIDLEAADAAAVSEAAKGARNGANGTAADILPDVEVEKEAPAAQKAAPATVSPDEGLEKLKSSSRTSARGVWRPSSGPMKPLAVKQQPVPRCKPRNWTSSRVRLNV